MYLARVNIETFDNVIYENQDAMPTMPLSMCICVAF